MEVEKIVTVEYHIILDEDRAEWLREVMKEPLPHESLEDRKLRREFLRELIL